MTWPFPMQSAHPMLVHAPIGLLLTAAGLDLVAAIARRPAIHRAALWNLSLGAAGAAIAVISGLRAEQIAKHSFEIHEVMERHEQLGIAVAALAAALALWRLLRADRLARWERGATVVLAVALAGLLSYGAHLGGRLVYEFGVGGRFGAPPE